MTASGKVGEIMQKQQILSSHIMNTTRRKTWMVYRYGYNDMAWTLYLNENCKTIQLVDRRLLEEALTKGRTNSWQLWKKIIFYCLLCILQSRDLFAFSYNRSNLKDGLKSSYLLPKQTVTGTFDIISDVFPCSTCSACENDVTTNQFWSAGTERDCKIREAITCSSTHVVYLISCSCRSQYVRKANRQLRI